MPPTSAPADDSDKDKKKKKTTPGIPAPNLDQMRVASANFVKARQMIEAGNFDYAITLLKTCCKVDPLNVDYRVTLRKSQKSKYKNNLKGSTFSFFTASKFKAKIKAAKAGRDYARVLEYGEEVLSKNPWDMSASMDMAEAFEALGQLRMAQFMLDQLLEKYQKNSTLNRALARLYEKGEDFKRAAVLWERVLEANKNDVEAQHKANDLAAKHTIKIGYDKVVSGHAAGSPGEAGISGSKTHPAVGAVAAETPADKLARDEAPIRKRLEADPTEPALYVQLAALYRKYGDVERAKAVLQQGLGPTGNHFKVQIELLELELAPVRKNLDTADAKLKKLKAGDADDDGSNEEQLTATRTKLQRELLTREVAITRLRAENFPNDLSHRLELGHTLLKLGQLDESVAELQKVKRDEKLKGKASLLLGAAFKKKGRSAWPLAQRNFEDALTALPTGDEANRKEALYQFATGSADNGDVGRAMELGHELANLDFGYKNIGKLLDEWHAQAG